jgi:tetratricopeptide (TPR) repeat protein
MKTVSPGWYLALLVALCFTLATLLVPRVGWWNDVPRAADWNAGRSQSENVFKLLFGEGRRLFGNEMFAMADAYFHSGYYPSIFDKPVTEPDVAERSEGTNESRELDRDDFLGPPPDWIAALDRQFVPNRHTHLNSGGASGGMNSDEVAEILPWLKLATDMNPQFIQAYRVGDYWLRRLHKPMQARELLFEGLHNNPGNNELLFDLGWLYNEDFHDANRARNVWVAGLRCWIALPPAAQADPPVHQAYEDTAMNLATLEEDQGNWREAIKYLEMVKQISPNPDAIQKQIDEAKQKMAAQPGANHP